MKNNQNNQTIENWLVLNNYRYNYRYTKSRSPSPKMAPMLFLCGAFQNSNSWRRFENHFSAFTDVIVVELPGNGQSDTFPAQYGIDYYRQALLQVLADTNLPRVYLIAASYGTPIAYDFSQHYPEKVERLVLAGTMRKIPEHMRNTIKHSLVLIEQGNLKEFTDRTIKALCSNTLLNKSARYSLGARVLKSQLQQYSKEEQEKYSENTKRLLQMEPLKLSSPPNVKTLVFTGEYDEFTRPEHCEEIANAIPEALFTTIKNADHLFHLQQFKTTVELLENFGQERTISDISGCNHVQLKMQSAA